MRISKFNHEGYYDPTTYRAFKNIEKDEKRKARFRPLVYICSPYAGGNKEKNIANAQRYCRFAVDSGCLPLAPHLYFPQFMDDSDGHDHNTAMFMNMMRYAAEHGADGVSVLRDGQIIPFSEIAPSLEGADA